MSKTSMEQLIVDEFGLNANYVTDLYHLYLQNPALIEEDWRSYFEELIEGNNQEVSQLEPVAAKTVAQPQPQAAAIQPVTAQPTVEKAIPTPTPTPTPTPAPTSVSGSSSAPAPAPATESKDVEKLQIVGPALRIAENMAASLIVPTATSQREISIKMLDENRRLMNQHLELSRRKISFTHIIAYSILKALKKFPQLNDSYEETDGKAYRVRRSGVNLGIAVDVTRKDGTRALMVPNIKNANQLSFAEFVQAYDDSVKRARDGKLQISDFQGTTVSLTNPGTLGTTASNPRLMVGQGLIIATGALEYPPAYQAMSSDSISRLGISKVMILTSTYDHRIVQGAESGSLLAYMDDLLKGQHGFYEEIFKDMKIPFKPYRWAIDQNPALQSNVDKMRKHGKVLALINAYRVRGHLIADIDPLGRKILEYHPELDIESYGLTVWDLDRDFLTDGVVESVMAPLRQIIDRLQRFYCSKVGIEYRHIQSPEEKEWIRSRIEREPPPVPAQVKKQILWKLVSAEQFEKFLAVKYLGQKRFSVEGAEGIVAVLDQLVESAGSREIEDITIGMAHRGRLNVLANVIGHFCERIFTSFEGSIHPKFPHDQGDVKYHQGASGMRETADGRKVFVSVLPNPSHLEFVDPVVQGAVRAKQDLIAQPAARPGTGINPAVHRVMAVLVHGDAAFAGEGIVPETLNLSQLAGYATGGTIHVIVNNQLGFTTAPEESRSSTYSTDVAKMVQAPIFHINGDDLDAAYNILQIALDYRQKFQKDVVLDVLGFRRHGHNEGDEPTYTQPVMYRIINAHPGVRELYARKLIKEGVVTAEEAAGMIKYRVERYENALLGAKEIVSRQDARPTLPPPFVEPDVTLGLATGVPYETLKEIIETIGTVPKGFNVNPKIASQFGRREKMLRGEVAVDWGIAELLAFGSLMIDGTQVRVSGQDSVRGTFSQRHAALYDTQHGTEWLPLARLKSAQARFQVYDSPLSEAGVLGFEYGYSVSSPDSLVVWEAQFGDFVNAAQVIIDQFIVSAEERWHQNSRLVMLLPHGYEGQGPEHSSARFERFLQLCARGNIQVAICTTAAQYFHLLRRQMMQQVHKPLIVMTPKSLLRFPEASSHISEFSKGEFYPLLGDTMITNPAAVKRVLFCTGKVYFDLATERKKLGDSTTAILRLEQLYPWAKTLITEQLNLYSNAEQIRWVQEEPQNMGAWEFVRHRLQPLLKPNQTLNYVGRAANPSAATGSYTIHQMEQRQLVEDSFKA